MTAATVTERGNVGNTPLVTYYENYGGLWSPWKYFGTLLIDVYVTTDVLK